MSEQKITLNDLTETQREMAELIGLEAYLKLCRRFGGSSPYIPEYDEVEKPSRDRKIKEDFDGYNIRDIARKYGLSERHMYNILPQKFRKKKRSEPSKDQLKFY